MDILFCTRCAKKFYSADVNDCACGGMFCDRCYVIHSLYCPETLNAALEREGVKLPGTGKK